MIGYRVVFATLLSVMAMTPQIASAQRATRAASADDLAIARMESVATVKHWGDGVSLTDRALIGCIGGNQAEKQTSIANTCGFSLVIEGVMGALNKGNCAGTAAISERFMHPGRSVTASRIEGELPCLVEVTRLGVSAATNKRPETIDAAVAVIVKLAQRGRTEVFNKSGNTVTKPWAMLRSLSDMAMTQRCQSSFAVPELIDGEGEGLGTPSKTMGVNWSTVSIVRVFENTVTFIDGWMAAGEVGIFILPTPEEAELLVAAFETLVLRC